MKGSNGPSILQLQPFFSNLICATYLFRSEIQMKIFKSDLSDAWCCRKFLFAQMKIYIFPYKNSCKRMHICTKHLALSNASYLPSVRIYIRCTSNASTWIKNALVCNSRLNLLFTDCRNELYFFSTAVYGAFLFSYIVKRLACRFRNNRLYNSEYLIAFWKNRKIVFHNDTNLTQSKHYSTRIESNDVNLYHQFISLYICILFRSNEFRKTIQILFTVLRRDHTFLFSYAVDHLPGHCSIQQFGSPKLHTIR